MWQDLHPDQKGFRACELAFEISLGGLGLQGLHGLGLTGLGGVGFEGLLLLVRFNYVGVRSHLQAGFPRKATPPKICLRWRDPLVSKLWILWCIPTKTSSNTPQPKHSIHSLNSRQNLPGAYSRPAAAVSPPAPRAPLPSTRA